MKREKNVVRVKKNVLSTSIPYNGATGTAILIPTLIC